MSTTFSPEALERWRLFQEQREAIERAARRWVDSSADAADLVQEVELHVLRHGTGPRPDSCFRAWCFALLRNAASDHRRALARRARAELSSAEAMIAADHQCTIDPDLGLELGRLAQSIETLTCSARDLVIRRYVLEQTASEIARDFNSSPPAVRMKLKRLRSKLRQLLGALPPILAGFIELLADVGRTLSLA